MRWCGWLLSMGLPIFMVGAVFWRPSWFQAPLLSDVLRNQADHHWIWMWIHAWLATGVVVTAVGLGVWVELQREVGERVATPAAVVLYLIGAVLWLVAIALRVTVQEWASQQSLSGVVPTGYASVHALSGLLHAGHMVLSYVSVVALGAGLLRPRGFAWTGVVAGTACGAGFVLLRGGPFGAPVLAHVYSFALGVHLLRSERFRSRGFPLSEPSETKP